MKKISRRAFHKAAGATLVAGVAAGVTTGVTGARPARAAAPRVVVVGGGFAGASTAKRLRNIDPGIAVTLIEPKKTFYTCPFSSHVVAGLAELDSIAQNYDALRRRHAVTVVQDAVRAVDAARRRVTLAGGGTVPYDRLVMAPGIGFRWNDVEGYDRAASEIMPHAWNAGPQTMLLRRQLRAMADGGLVIVSPPPGLYRCGPAPYERVSLIADYLKRAKPRSKILVLDPKDRFAQQEKFLRGWEALYGDMIEWLSLSDDGKVVRVDPRAMAVETDFGEVYKAAVVNFIPGQQAGEIALAAGLADASGWCPIDPLTFESTIHPGIHVLGDSALAAPMPKSAYTANSAAKVVAAAVAALVRGRAPDAAPGFGSLCYSLIGPGHGIKIAGSYTVEDGAFTPGAKPHDAADPARDAAAAVAWYRDITAEVFG